MLRSPSLIYESNMFSSHGTAPRLGGDSGDMLSTMTKPVLLSGLAHTKDTVIVFNVTFRICSESVGFCFCTRLEGRDKFMSFHTMGRHMSCYSDCFYRSCRQLTRHMHGWCRSGTVGDSTWNDRRWREMADDATSTTTQALYRMLCHLQAWRSLDSEF